MLLTTPKEAERMLRSILQAWSASFRSAFREIYILVDSEDWPRGKDWVVAGFSPETGKINFSLRSCSPDYIRFVNALHFVDDDTHIVQCTANIEGVRYVLEVLRGAANRYLEEYPNPNQEPEYMGAKAYSYRWDGRQANDLLIHDPGKFENCHRMVEPLWELAMNSAWDELFFDESDTEISGFLLTDEQRKLYQTDAVAILLWEDDQGFVNSNTFTKMDDYRDITAAF